MKTIKTAPLQEKVIVAVAQQLLRGWRTAGTGIVVAVMLAYTHRHSVPAWFLGGWLAAFVMLSIALFMRWRAKKDLVLDPSLSRQVITENMVAAGAYGLVWGTGSAVLLAHGGGSGQLMVLLTLFALSIIILFGASYHYPTFLIFFFLSVGPSVPALLFQTVPGDRGLAVLMVSFIVTMCMLSRNLNRMVMQSLALRFENLALVEELTLQKEIAEEASLSKSRFLAAASHDLRQPVHAFSLYLGALGTLDLPAQARSLAGKLSQCMHSMEGLFRALLDVSQLDAGAVRPNFDVFCIATLLDRLRVEFEPQAQAKGLKLRVAPCSVLVASDQALTERIIRNLLANAVRYSDTGKVLLGCRRRGNKLRVAVYDTGIGIASEDQSRVFEEFLQLGNPQRDRSQGLGLGLSIVKRLAHLLQLHLEVHSRPGQGSVFSIDVPIADRSTRASSAVETPSISSAGLAGRTIVVIDDEVAVLESSRTLMEAWGCIVVAAASGEEAIKLLEDFSMPPDLLVCDYRLTGSMNGMEVVQHIREEFNADFPAILVTGDTEPERLQELESSGLPVLHKPMDPLAMRQALLLALE